jgi:hypothetical protein
MGRTHHLPGFSPDEQRPQNPQLATRKAPAKAAVHEVPQRTAAAAGRQPRLALERNRQQADNARGNQRAAPLVQVLLFLAVLGICSWRRYAADISTHLRGAAVHSVRRRRSMVRRVGRQ